MSHVEIDLDNKNSFADIIYGKMKTLTRAIRGMEGY